MSDLFGNPKDRFSRVAAQLLNVSKIHKKLCLDSSTEAEGEIRSL